MIPAGPRSRTSVSGTAAGRDAAASIRSGKDISRRAGPPAWACSSRAGQPGRSGRGTAISASSTDSSTGPSCSGCSTAASTQPLAWSSAAVTATTTGVPSSPTTPTGRRVVATCTRSAGRSAAGGPPARPAAVAVRAALPGGSAGSASAFTSRYSDERAGSRT
ncbi:hypothetical protein ACH4UY_37730 [Streptomyces longwoodensis]|uniref:hypothetical protein n=1 Tax=Streptomyces longwoodensis TaxID=68231 RepID=UPI0037AB1052